jgi:hypothetical protein
VKYDYASSNYRCCSASSITTARCTTERTGAGSTLYALIDWGELGRGGANPVGKRRAVEPDAVVLARVTCSSPAGRLSLHIDDHFDQDAAVLRAAFDRTVVGDVVVGLCRLDGDDS